MNGVATVLMERLTDATHLSVAEAARFARVSTKTIRNRIISGLLTLETIPGTKRYGIAIAQLASGWVSAKQVSRLRERNRR